MKNKRFIDVKKSSAKGKLIFWLTIFFSSLLTLIVLVSIAGGDHNMFIKNIAPNWISWYVPILGIVISSIGILYVNECVVKCNLEYHYLKNRSEIEVFNKCAREELMKETLKSAKYGIFTKIPNVTLSSWRYDEGENKRADYVNDLIDFTNTKIIDKELGLKDDAIKKNTITYWLQWIVLVLSFGFLFTITVLAIYFGVKNNFNWIIQNQYTHAWKKLFLLFLPIGWTLLLGLLLHKDLICHMIDNAADFYNLQTHKNKLAGSINPENSSKEDLEKIKADNIKVVVEDLNHGLFSMLGNDRIYLESRIREGRWDYINSSTFNKETVDIKNLKLLEHNKKEQWEQIKQSNENAVLKNNE